MLVLYAIGAGNLGQALAVAQQRAHRDRWANISISSTSRTVQASWMLVLESPGNDGPLGGG